MKTQKILFLLHVIILCTKTSLFAWTSSNEGVCYTMDTLCVLSEDISYNAADQLYEIDCHIVIMQNDTLRLQAGETLKFLSYPGGPPIRFELVIYGNLLAIGEKNKMITFGDPEATFTAGSWWQGIKFLNTSKNGESVLKYCNIRGAANLQVELETAIYCENSSPIFDHCIFQYIASSELTGGASALGLKGQSYPLVMYCNFHSIFGVAVWCNPYNYQDTIDYPSPLMVGCNIASSVQGFVWPQCDYDKVILYGGFLDNCFLEAGSVFCDITLGYPIDTIGDGVCSTTSTYDPRPRFLLIDGVVNPRNSFLITGVNENEIGELPTTSKYISLKNNFPNPFSNFTTIEFELKEKASLVNLIVLDSKGSIVKFLIKNQSLNPGEYQKKWHGDNDAGQKLPEGIYFYKLTAGNNLMVKKAIVIK